MPQRTETHRLRPTDAATTGMNGYIDDGCGHEKHCKADANCGEEKVIKNVSIS